MGVVSLVYYLHCDLSFGLRPKLGLDIKLWTQSLFSARSEVTECTQKNWQLTYILTI